MSTFDPEIFPQASESLDSAVVLNGAELTSKLFKQSSSSEPANIVDGTRRVADPCSVDSAQVASDKKTKRRRADAASMAKAQKEISVSEFFAKNRHLLGFDNPRKALLTTVKEAVDNSLDACEEAGILPEI